jgi:hypothetical protein
MPQMNPVSWCIWVAVIAAQCTVAVILVRSRQWRVWASVFSFVAFESALSLGLLGIRLFMADTDLRAATYFYTYWSGAVIAQAFEIWIIVQLCGALIGVSKSIRRAIRVLVPSLALINLAWSVTLSLETKMPVYSAIMRGVCLLDKSISLGWIATFLAVALGAEFSGIEWPHGARLIAIGLAIELASTVACTWLSDLFPSIHFSNIKGIVYLAALALWSIPPREDNDLGLDAEKVSAYLETYTHAFKRIRAKLS